MSMLCSDRDYQIAALYDYLYERGLARLRARGIIAAIDVVTTKCQESPLFAAFAAQQEDRDEQCADTCARINR